MHNENICDGSWSVESWSHRTKHERTWDSPSQCDHRDRSKNTQVEVEMSLMFDIAELAIRTQH